MTPLLKALAAIPFETMRAVCLGVYRLSGWRLSGALPETRKFIVIAAPHTSNWDLPLALCIAMHFRVRLHWMGKASLFRPPFGWIMRLLGGVPVDRSKSNNAVDQMVERFAGAERFILGVLPEGTRSQVDEWKTGFYHMARGAGVPIVLAFIDYGKKLGGVGEALEPSGDYERDLAAMKAFYAGVTGKGGMRA